MYLLLTLFQQDCPRTRTFSALSHEREIGSRGVQCTTETSHPRRSPIRACVLSCHWTAECKCSTTYTRPKSDTQVEVFSSASAKKQSGALANKRAVRRPRSVTIQTTRGCILCPCRQPFNHTEDWSVRTLPGECSLSNLLLALPFGSHTYFPREEIALMTDVRVLCELDPNEPVEGYPGRAKKTKQMRSSNRYSNDSRSKRFCFRGML